MFALLTSAAIAFFVDQSSKRSVQAHLTEAVSWGGILQIRHVQHSQQLYKRAALRIALVVIWVAALVSAAWLHKSGQWLQRPFAMASIGCALGGAAGNLMDILQRQQVTDFIDLGWWPVFNLADVAIVGGLALAFWP
jgi:signal peptidase II